MTVALFNFCLHDAHAQDRVRIVVEMSAPRRADNIDASDTVMYAVDLKLGSEIVPVRQVYGLSPVECLATALASIDLTLHRENARAPLVWDDGRPYGGDWDLPLDKLVAQFNQKAQTALIDLAFRLDPPRSRGLRRDGGAPAAS